MGWASPALAQPIVQQHWPAANAVSAAPGGGVRVLFGLAPGKKLHAPPLWVFSAQRGGRRTTHSGQLERVGQQLFFRPTYDFLPGEVVYATTWAMRLGGPVAQPQLWQFTAAVGGTGVGNFGPGADLAAPALAPGLALGDVDGDGDLDVLTASASTSQVRVRLNGDAAGSGTGHYDAGTLVEAGYPSYSLALGDVDGDGDLDLVAGSDHDNMVSVRLNGGDATGSGTGRFGKGSETYVGGCATPLSVALADVDGDGDLDLLATSNCGTGAVRVRLNGGDALGTNTGVFSKGGQVAVGSNPFGLALGDVDGDGDLDIVTANLGGTVSVRLNGGDATGGGTGSFSGGSEVAVGAGAVGLTLGDVDGDGDLDLLTANFTAGTVSVRLNGSNAAGGSPGRFGAGAEVPVNSQPQRVALADVDHDGDLDLLAACTGAGTVSVRLNGGDATGSNSGSFSGGGDPAAGTAPVGLALGDVDGDGDLDVLTTSPTTGQLSVRLNPPGPQPATATGPPASSSEVLRPRPGRWLVQVFPNPMVQAPALTISTEQGGPATLLLADALGRPLSQQQLTLSSGTTTLPLATAQDLASGVYLLQVRQGSQQQLLRLIRP